MNSNKTNDRLYNQAVLQELLSYIEELKVFYNEGSVKIFEIKPNEVPELEENDTVKRYNLMINHNMLSSLMGHFVHVLDDKATKFFNFLSVNDKEYIRNLDQYLMEILDIYGKFAIHFKAQYYIDDESKRNELINDIVDMTLHLMSVRYILSKTFDYLETGRYTPPSESILKKIHNNHVRKYDLENNFKDQFHEVTYALMMIRSEFSERILGRQISYKFPKTKEEIESILFRTVKLIENSLSFLYQLIFDIDNHFLEADSVMYSKEFSEKMEKKFIERYKAIMLNTGVIVQW